jgi:hypothetical protein
MTSESHLKEEEEKSLLDDIEASSSRFLGSSRLLHVETSYHNKLLSGILDGVDHSSNGLRSQSERVDEYLRTKGGNTWLYCCIGLQSVLFVYLIFNLN